GGCYTFDTMTQALANRYVSYRAYAAAETTSDIKHEWLDGAVYDMAGGTPEHGGLCLATRAEPRSSRRDRPCRGFSSGLRGGVLKTGLGTYPDATVVRNRLETDQEDDRSITNPVVLVEVLSDSTEAYDRGKKFAHYRQIPSLREYVMVSQHEP